MGCQPQEAVTSGILREVFAIQGETLCYVVFFAVGQCRGDDVVSREQQDGKSRLNWIIFPSWLGTSTTIVVGESCLDDQVCGPAPSATEKTKYIKTGSHHPNSPAHAVCTSQVSTL